jgi:outer membrane protein with beta-barrel domain
MRCCALMLIALAAVTADASEEFGAPAKASVSLGVGPLLVDEGASGGVGLSYSLVPYLALTLEAQGAINSDGDTGLLASAGINAMLLPRHRVSPYALANYGWGQAYQDNGKAIQLGAGLSARLDRRWSAFVETRFTVIDAGGYDMPYLDWPLRAGVRLDLP